MQQITVDKNSNQIKSAYGGSEYNGRVGNQNRKGILCREALRRKYYFLIAVSIDSRDLIIASAHGVCPFFAQPILAFPWGLGEFVQRPRERACSGVATRNHEVQHDVTQLLVTPARARLYRHNMDARQQNPRQ